MKFKVIAVDFDGTLCENKWPKIGEPNEEVFDYLKEQKQQGAKLILWTCRTNEKLENAVAWCEKHDLKFDAVNENISEAVDLFGEDTRKVFAHEYIDDKSNVKFKLPFKSNTNVKTGERKAMNMKELQKDIYQNAFDHGWHDEDRTFGDIVALCHSELSEALEEYRNREPMIYCKERGECEGNDECYKCFADAYKYKKKMNKPEGMAVEMADCIIRILDWAESVGVDMEDVICVKHEYNKTRPYRHGGKQI